MISSVEQDWEPNIVSGSPSCLVPHFNGKQPDAKLSSTVKGSESPLKEKSGVITF